MIWLAVAHIFSVILELINISRMSDHDKDLEILVLRYQLGIADRKLNRAIHPDPLPKYADLDYGVVNASYWFLRLSYNSPLGNQWEAR